MLVLLGMGAGQKDYNVVNVGVLNERFSEGEVVSLASLEEKRVLDISGREKKLPLKVLGDGAIEKNLTVEAVAFSKAAKEKIESAGGKVVELPGKKKWMRARDK